MFGPDLQRWARSLVERLVRPLARLGLTPNVATVIGLLLNIAAASVIASGALRLGGLALLIASLFDLVDGALARIRNQKTTFGAFFDSTIDRYSEGLTLLGVIVFALRQPATATHAWVVGLAYTAMLGSLMVSYTRARAEGLGLSLKTGLMARPERVVLLAAGLILGGASWLVWTLLALAVTSVFTSIQRVRDVSFMLAQERITEAQSAAPRPQAAPATERQTSANGHAGKSTLPTNTQKMTHVSPESSPKG